MRGLSQRGLPDEDQPVAREREGRPRRGNEEADPVAGLRGVFREVCLGRRLRPPPSLGPALDAASRITPQREPVEAAGERHGVVHPHADRSASRHVTPDAERATLIIRGPRRWPGN